MKPWRDCRSKDERAEAVSQALREYGTIERAAAALGITRRHLTRLLAPGESRRLKETMATANETRETEETSCLTETKDAPETIGTPATAGPTETRTSDRSLTYGGFAPTFRDVSTLATKATETSDPRVSHAVTLLDSLWEWARIRAVKTRKSASEVIEDLVRQEKDREDADRIDIPISAVFHHEKKDR